MEAPSPNGMNGRNALGQFVPGNPGGPGNPFARRCARLRKAFLEAVSEEDIQAIVRKLLERAKGGDLAAIKLVFLWILGKPGEPIVVDAVLREEDVERLRAEDEDTSTSLMAPPDDRRQRERLAVAELLRETRAMITERRDALAGDLEAPDT